MFCIYCGSNIPEDSKFCIHCGKPMQQQTQIPKKSNGKLIAKILGITGAIALLLIAVIAGVIFFFGGDSKNIKFGEQTLLGTYNANNSGGDIIISDISSEINGMTISIPQQAFDENVTFEISQTEIVNHKFGDIFEPVTPLITVNNDSRFANAPMQVSIPIEITEDEFAMGFYYDRKTGILEAIPFESLSNDEIVLRTSHFSDIIISKTTKNYLLSYEASIDSEFVPGIDDWQFINYGSALAPGGHCAGQSLSMVWYYNTQKLRNNEPSLYGLFDNNGKGATSQFQEDDALSYRFTSVIQDTFDFESPTFYDYVDMSLESQKNTYLSFAYALIMTKSPQFMGIYSVSDNGDFLGGHAIVAYRLSDRKIYVADPNYPGKNNRYVNFTGENFLPYSSGANAAAIEDGSGTYYNKIVYVGQSALVDFKTIEIYYGQMLQGFIGTDLMPTLNVSYMSKYSQDHRIGEYILIDGNFKYNDHPSFPEERKGQVMLAATTGYFDVVYTLYRGTTPVTEPSYPDPSNNVAYFLVELDSNINDYGILAQVVDDDRLLFTDFKRFEISYSVRKENIIDFDSGDVVSFGNYEQDNNLTNGPEPILWRVLAIEGDRALVITQDIIDNVPYHNMEEEVTWESSYLRHWLNNDFLFTAFDDSQRQIIMQSYLINNDNSFGTPGGNNTIDNVFSLSIDEAGIYFKNSKDRLAKTTAVTRAKGGETSAKGYGTWWLRSPGRLADRGATVAGFTTDQYEFHIEEGDVVETGTYGSNYRVSVRPSMWISLYTLAKQTTPTSTPNPTTGSIDDRMVGTYNLNSAGLNARNLNFWKIELNTNKTFEASYQANRDTYVGGYEGSWEVVNKDGENWLILDSGGDIDECLISNNLNGFRIIVGEEPMYFEK